MICDLAYQCQIVTEHDPRFAGIDRFLFRLQLCEKMWVSWQPRGLPISHTIRGSLEAKLEKKMNVYSFRCCRKTGMIDLQVQLLSKWAFSEHGKLMSRPAGERHQSQVRIGDDHIFAKA